MEIRVKEQPKELENRVKWPYGKKKNKGKIYARACKFNLFF